MAKPIHVPVWATTTLYATSADPTAVGEPTKEDPSSIAAQGWDFLTRPRPTHLNYWQNEVGAWLGWVNTDVLSTEGGTFTLLDALVLTGGSLSLNLEVTHPAGEDFFENGAFYVTATGSITVQSGGELNLASGSVTTFASGAALALATGSVVSGNPTNEATITNTGAGHIVPRKYSSGGGNQSLGIAQGDVLYAPIGAAGFIWTIANATEGCMLTVNARAITAGSALTLKNADASTICIVANTTAGDRSWVDLQFDFGTSKWLIAREGFAV